MSYDRRTELKLLQALDPARDFVMSGANTDAALAVLLGRTTAEPASPQQSQVSIVLPDAAPTRARRRRGRVVLVTAVLLAVSVGGVLAVTAIRSTASRETTGTARSQLGLYALIIGFASGSGIHIADIEASNSSQTVGVVSDNDPQLSARVSASTSGSASASQSGNQGTINLGRGVVAHWVDPTYPPGISGPPQSAILTWQSDGLTLGVQGALGSDTPAIVTVARAVEIVPPLPIKVPVAASALPTDWKAVRFGTASTTGADNGGLKAEVIVDPDPNAKCCLETDQTFAASLRIDVRAAGVTGDTGAGDPVAINSRSWQWNSAHTELTWYGPDRTVSVGTMAGADTAETPPREDLVTLVATLRFSDSFENVATWFDASDAF